MGLTETRLWDPAEHLQTPEDMAAYLEAALEEGDPKLVAAVLGDIARAQGMAEIARAAGLGRESLYKALSPEGNPELATVLKVVRALGLQLTATSSSTAVKQLADLLCSVTSHRSSDQSVPASSNSRFSNLFLRGVRSGEELVEPPRDLVVTIIG